MPTQTMLLISTATEWDGLYFPPRWGRKVPLKSRGELAARFLAKRYLWEHEYCVYLWWRTGWMVEHWRDFFIFLWKSFVPKINHHVGVMATGNIGIPRVLFNLTLRAWEPVDFSNRHPWAGREQATRDGAVLQELIMNKSSELVGLSGTGSRSSGQEMGLGPEFWLQDADLPGKVMGSRLLQHGPLLNNANYELDV